MVDGAPLHEYGGIITKEDAPQLATGRAARIRGQVEADQARIIAAAAWRRGLGPFGAADTGPDRRPLGWHR